MSQKKPNTNKDSRSTEKPEGKEGGEQQSKKAQKATEKETNKKDQKGDQKADQTKASQKGSQKNAPKANKDARKDTQKEAQKPSATDDAKDVSKDDPKDTNKDDEKDDSVDNHADILPDDDDGTVASVKEQRPTSKISPDDVHILREIIRRQLEDEGYAPSAPVHANSQTATLPVTARSRAGANLRLALARDTAGTAFTAPARQP
ncbi:hypothetical protein MTO96_010906 [Rhipicephalus appendiculatus]